MASRLRAAQKTWDPANLRSLWAAARAKNPALPVTPKGGFTPNLGFKPFSPWSSSPPSGTYDPALDAAKGAADRGFHDLEDDIGTQNTRDTVDYGLGREDIIRGGMEAETDRQTRFAREGEDYGRNVAMLQRAYRIKGQNQLQQANAYGVLGGGAMLQAKHKRAANEALDRQPLDTAHTRFQSDSALEQQRLHDSTDRSLGKLALEMAPPDASNPLGGRRFQDRGTQLTRGGRENTQFGIDTEAQKGFQAAGTGWDPGTRPKGEFLSEAGHPYQVRVVGGIKYRVGRGGRVLSMEKRKRR